MKNQPDIRFTMVFATVTGLEMLGDTLAIRWLHYSSKPLIMILLLGYVFYWFKNPTGYLRWLLVGMVFALLGDSLLMIQEVDLFAPGLGAFLVMQVCYGVVFWQSAQPTKSAEPRPWAWRFVMPFMLYLTAFLVVLYPSFAQNQTLQPLWWPVVVYASCLNVMGILAVQRRGLPGYVWVVAGALLFILSDSAIAINKFLHPIAGATWLIISTYATAQYLIVTGMVKAVVR